MRAVILASGRSQRLKPVRDKVSLEFCGRTLLEHQVIQLANNGFSDLTIIYGAHNHEHLKNLSSKLVITPELVEQEDLDLGMAGAVLSYSKVANDEPFVLISSNDIISEGGIKHLVQAIKKAPKSSHIIAKKVTDYFPGGYLQIDAKKHITQIVEKPEPGTEPSDLINLVYHYHANPEALFETVKKTVKRKKRNNIDLYEQALQNLFDQGQIYKAVSYAGPWQTIKYPWQIWQMANYIFEKEAKQISSKAEVAPTAIIEGQVIICDGAKIMHHAVIKGPAYIGENTVVANNCLVRDSFIGDNCVIGFNSEVARSVIQNDTWLHNNYIGDSVIGQNVSFGAGTVTGNFRLDEKAISMNIKGQRTNTGQNKLGIFTGDNIRVGINTSFMPGVKIGGNTMIGAKLIIAEDIPQDSFVKVVTKTKIKKNNQPIPKCNQTV